MKARSLLIPLLFFQVVAFAMIQQTISGKVVARSSEGEQAAAYVNVLVFTTSGKLISKGKTNGEGVFSLHPMNGFNIIKEHKYKIVVEPAPQEKGLTGSRIKKASIVVKGSELNQVIIITQMIKNGNKGFETESPAGINKKQTKFH